jgi:isoaspartyl peptidase/L-asparaginase-like protein (Ntn-hydrolase superfamily)
VLDDARHVLLAGPGAEAFARAAGLAFEPEEWFVTDHRRQLLRRALAAPGGPVGHPVGGSTVGAVARDAHGHLAAATSTGGRNGQMPGRVGDSPVPGAGTWADDATCAVSATGVGEAFLRTAFAHEVDARLRLEGLGLDAACREALAAVTSAGGDGGCIALTAQGPPVMPFTTALMHRGWAEVGGALFVAAE